jgi:hypothetical protein
VARATSAVANGWRRRRRCRTAGAAATQTARRKRSHHDDGHLLIGAATCSAAQRAGREATASAVGVTTSSGGVGVGVSVGVDVVIVQEHARLATQVLQLTHAPPLLQQLALVVSGAGPHRSGESVALRRSQQLRRSLRVNRVGFGEAKL